MFEFEYAKLPKTAVDGYLEPRSCDKVVSALDNKFKVIFFSNFQSLICAFLANSTDEAVMSYTGLNSYHMVQRLVSNLEGGYGFMYKRHDWQHLYGEGVQLLGDLGYFNLEE